MRRWIVCCGLGAMLLVSQPFVLGSRLDGASERTENDRPGSRADSDPPGNSSETVGEVREGPRRISPASMDVGRLVPNLEFKDVAGRAHRLSEFRNAKAIVIAMTGTECPLSQKYAPTLAALERSYRDRGVVFVFVNPSSSETPADVRTAIATHGFVGPCVHDPDGRIARLLQARTTTECFVLDAARTLVYRGAVDDQYGFGYARTAARHEYLRDAIEAVLKARRPSVAATTAPGCELWWDDRQPAVDDPAAEVTWHNRISRIVQNHCLECHRQGGVGPFKLETPEQVIAHAGMIRRVVPRRLMPPWFAAPPADGSLSPWANDRSLPAADRRDLLAWLEGGRKLGDPADAPLPRQFPTEWEIGKPDVVLSIPRPITIQATGQMPYQNVRIETGFDEDRWLQAVEIQPTDSAVVHHVLVFVVNRSRGRIDERGGFLAAYVPGNSYQVFPNGFGKRIPAGATLHFQLHYTPVGRATEDQTRLGLVFCRTPPRHVVRNAGIANHRIAIPPRAPAHPERAVLPVPADVMLLAFMPHMHLRGKAFRYELIRPDGRRQTLLDVPRYDFNWQLQYELAEPLPVPRGSRIEVTGWYDNSPANPANPDPNRTVRWGPQTDDEMLLGYVEYFVPDEGGMGAVRD